MSVVLTFSIPADQFPLGPVVAAGSDVRASLEPVVPIGESAIPCLRLRTGDVDAATAALEACPGVETVRVEDRFDDGANVRLTWLEPVGGVVASMRESAALLLEATGHDGRWSFQLRFADSVHLSRFYRSAVENDLSLDITGVHQREAVRVTPASSLSDEQREALATALDAGYFDVPREATLVDLAEQLGISDTAVSQRIRRGLATLLTAGLLEE